MGEISPIDGLAFRERPVKIGWNARFGALFFVKGWLQCAVEIALHQFVKRILWIKVFAATEEMKPFATIGHVMHLFGIDHV